MQNTRDALLSTWLNSVLTSSYQLSPLSGDASFRRYLRLHVGDASYMVMDAPPDKEQVDEFISIAEFLMHRHVRVPDIVAKDQAQGFLLLEDFGDELLSAHLLEHRVHALYTQAMRQIIQMQRIPNADVASALPSYNANLLETEMDLFSTWFLPYIGVELDEHKTALWQRTKRSIIEAVLAQPQCFVHRDYHSRNLMVLGDQSEFGIIDFQDAVIGAHSYDLVSVIRDAYVAWPKAYVRSWITEFWHMQKQAGIATADSPSAFEAQVDIMGVQRQLKVLGIFVRLAKRDGKTGYLSHLPQVMAYVLDECARLPELSAFYQWLTQDIEPKFSHKIPA